MDVLLNDITSTKLAEDDYQKIMQFCESYVLSNAEFDKSFRKGFEEKKRRNKKLNNAAMEEEAELAKAISLSLKEAEMKKQPQTDIQQSPTNAYDSARKQIAIPVSSGSGILKNKTEQKVRALYDFEAAEDNELSFKEADVITLLDSSDPNWWRGKLHNREGLFPAQFVTSELGVEKSSDPTASSSKSVKFSDKMQLKIDAVKISKCLELLSSIDPSASEATDPPEMPLLEHQCEQMNVLVDSEIQMVEQKLDAMNELEKKMVDVLGLYNQIAIQQPPQAPYQMQKPIYHAPEGHSQVNIHYFFSLLSDDVQPATAAASILRISTATSTIHATGQF
ncbi:hypothetical protein Ciccas_007747 [Cichlidogyrus casuarinus]|uniref:SH3 domain-containing protein n=1 Tax=Cichlidogyrus casuarinus TaxID=1844966 RepID=A0ABD2Q203_9PLAT